MYICARNEASQFNPIGWWNSNTLKFRTLSKIACDFLSIPISIVVLESAFSASGRVIKPHCSSLATNTVQALLVGKMTSELLFY